jgi:anti-sigma-K factor RskA
MSDAPDRDLLAAEYVLGVLEAEDARTVRAFAARNAAMAASIADWQARLAPLVEALHPVRPPRGLWTRVEASIDEDSERPESVIERGRPGVGGRVWQSRGFWRAATAASLALAAGIAAVAVLRVPLGPAAPTYVAALAPLDAPKPSFVAEVRADGSVIVRAVAPVTVPSGRDLELWVLPPGAKTPRSLGVLPTSGKSFTLAEAPPAQAQILVSLEPTGGSPTGLPTGPVLFGGTLTALN